MTSETQGTIITTFKSTIIVTSKGATIVTYAVLSNINAAQGVANVKEKVLDAIEYPSKTYP